MAAFLLTNKVWSPQFVLWLLPLAVLAWPRRRGLQPFAVVLFVLWRLSPRSATSWGSGTTCGPTRTR